jgi:hypothetical protein
MNHSYRYDKATTRNVIFVKKSRPRIDTMPEIDGLYKMDELLQYRDMYVDMPKCLIDYNKKINILLEVKTSDALTYRQQHPILKKITNLTELDKKIMEIFNTISEDNIDTFAEDILKIEEIYTYDGLKYFVNSLMKKVSNEKKFINIYSKLCEKLGSVYVKTNKGYTLISMVSAKCKEIFSKYINFEEDIVKNNKNDMNDEKFIKEYIYIVDLDGKLDKNKINNCVMFIGCLYNINIIKQSAVDYCINECLDNICNVEYCIEILINFIRTVNARYVNGCDRNGVNMKSYYTKLSDIKTKCKQKREQFMIQDLLDGR